MLNAFASLKCSKKCKHNVQKPRPTYLLLSQKIKMKILVFLALDKKAEPYQCRPVGVVITKAEVYDV